MQPPVRVIFVTDGDGVARRAVEMAAANLGLRCISASAGNPTPLEGKALVDLICSAQYDPVLVMVDDRGDPGYGRGEQALAYVAAHPAINVLGAIAVAADTDCSGVPVDLSVSAAGRVIPGPVDKAGRPAAGSRLKGDTVDVLNRLNLPVIVGIGDPGKMGGCDSPTHGAYLTTLAIMEVLGQHQDLQRPETPPDSRPPSPS